MYFVIFLLLQFLCRFEKSSLLLKIGLTMKNVLSQFFFFRLVAETSSDVYVQFMNITEPLTKLRSLLEQRTCKNLSDYKFYLQDFQEVNIFYRDFFVYLNII